MTNEEFLRQTQFRIQFPFFKAASLLMGPSDKNSVTRFFKRRKLYHQEKSLVRYGSHRTLGDNLIEHQFISHTLDGEIYLQKEINPLLTNK